MEGNLNDNETGYLSFEELQDAIEKDITDNPNKIKARHLLDAIIDWPTPNVEEPKDFVEEIKAEVKGELNFDNLTKYLNSLNPENDTWKMEAVSSLLEIFNIENNIDQTRTIGLESIIDELSNYYRK